MLVVAAAGCILAGCSGARGQADEPQRMAGTVRVIGNAPFTSLAIETREGRMLALRCTEPDERRLRDLQGTEVEITYRCVEPTPQGDALRVLDYRLLNGDQIRNQKTTDR